MSNPYQFWEDALAGKNPPIINEEPQCGFYRQKTGPRGSKTWQPVAIYPHNDIMACMIGDQEVTMQKAVESWPWFAANPVTEDQWRAVAERGEPWFDQDETAGAQAAESDGTPATLAKQIAEAIKAIDTYKTIESDEMASRAQDLRDRLNKMSGDADKTRKKLKAPHQEQADAVDAEWMPLVKEPKAAANILRTNMEAWEDTKREAAKKAAEAAQKEADRAIARGEEPPAPVAPNLPAPVEQIRGATGRAASVGTKKVAVIDDQDKVYEHFKERTDLKEFLLALAQKMVDAGIDVPGVSTTEKTKIK